MKMDLDLLGCERERERGGGENTIKRAKLLGKVNNFH